MKNVVHLYSPPFLQPSQIVGYTLSNLKRTSVTVSVSTFEEAILYYRISLAGTRPPTPDELRNLGPSQFLESRSVYGRKLIGETKSIQFHLESLKM